ncbi:MAG: portal protein [Cellvibrionaceae bacterium]
MLDYSDHVQVLETLKHDQLAEKDLRKKVAEVTSFMHHPDGQWEPEIASQFNGRPQYTFDQTKPQVNKAWAEMAANEYSAETQPCGGGASEDVSNIIDGLIRNIYNVSSFDDVSTKEGKRMIAGGSGYWRIVSTYIGEGFHQELKIVPISNANDRVWFDANSEMQTREDAAHVNILTSVATTILKDKYKDRDGDFQSVSGSIESNDYYNKTESNTITGEIIYKKPYTKTIYLLDDEDTSVVDDEGLERLGLTPDNIMVIESRECDSFKIYSRKYDNKGWLEEEKETVFKHLPVIAEYANFDVVENKVVYMGLVLPIIDHCRVFNYVESRKIEEAVLAPRQKILMDDRVVNGYTSEFSNINTNPNAIQLYKGGIVDAAPPITVGGINPSPALSELSADMIRNIEITSGLPNELTVLQNTANDSDFRSDQRTSAGQMGTFEYYRAHKVALEHTAKVLLGAIPKVYDSKRMVRVVGEDGQSSEVLINSADEIKNDLTLGHYDICVKVGPSFKDRKTEANTKLLEMGQYIPGLIDRNADILITNIDAPGMRSTRDRERERLFKSGMIPDEQLTDVEKQELEAMRSQPQQPDPNAMIAQAEVERVQGENALVQLKHQTEQIKLQQAQQKLNSDQEKIQLEAQLKSFELENKAQSQKIDDVLKLIKGLAEYKTALVSGGDVTGNEVEGYQEQAQLITEVQDQI